MRNHLNELLDAVADEASFLAFARALADDRRSELQIANSTQMPFDSGGWQSLTIESFLDAAIRWAEDSEFGARQDIGDNSWKKFAVFLYCGKIYE